MSFPYLQLESPLKAPQDRPEETLGGSRGFLLLLASNPLQTNQFRAVATENFGNFFDSKRNFRVTAANWRITRKIYLTQLSIFEG